MGIPCDRKTVGRNIDYLIDFGYTIKKVKGGGCYLEKNPKFDIDFNPADDAKQVHSQEDTYR